MGKEGHSEDNFGLSKNIRKNVKLSQKKITAFLY
jgi:hypothetical protein